MALAEGDPRHGTVNGYTNLKCRCAPCRAAWAESTREMKQRRRDSLSADDPRHGKYTTYSNYLCRCDACSSAWAFYTLKARERSRQGTKLVEIDGQLAFDSGITSAGEEGL